MSCFNYEAKAVKILRKEGKSVDNYLRQILAGENAIIRELKFSNDSERRANMLTRFTDRKDEEGSVPNLIEKESEGSEVLSFKSSESDDEETEPIQIP